MNRPGLRRKGRAFYFDAGGKPRRWIPLGSDEAVALKRYAQLVEESKPAHGTVDAMLAAYLANPREPLAAGTLVNYRVYRRHLSAVFGKLAPHEIEQQHVILYLRNCKRKSARGEISLLSMAFTAWVEQGRAGSNPVFGVHIRLPVSRRDRLLADAEIDAVVAQADERLAVAIELAYATGLRIGDLCALRWSDMQTAIRTQKTGARQAYEATDALTAILNRARALQARVAGLFVLCDRRGRAWKPDTLRIHWTKACKAAGVVDAHFHDLRAAGGTEVDRRGGDAQKFLGHKSRRTTEVYLRDKRVNVVTPIARRKA
jgi:integrase